MKRKNWALMGLLILLSLITLAGCKKQKNKIQEVPADASYGFENAGKTQAEPDSGFVIDGVLDEEAYQNNHWLYLHNDDGGNNVNIAMTSHYGENGMYFVYDVTESVPIYVNTKRASYLNSCIEMYLAPSQLSTVQDNSVLEIDLMPNGDMNFKKSNGAYGYTNVITTDDTMAVLGATTKGGEVNTPECYGYCLELFIPWDYLKWLDMDADAMRNSFVYVNPAHITSNNFAGTDTNLDRYWYYYAQQNGAEFGNVTQYFRFDGDGVIGTQPIRTEYVEHCTITCGKTVIPGMQSVITVTPEAGYTLTSIRANGQELMGKVSYNQDGSVTVKVRGTVDGITLSAKAEPVQESDSYTITGKIALNPAGSLEGAVYYYVGPNGEKPLEVDSEGNFTLADLKKGYYVIKAEKEGYQSVNRGIYLDRNLETQLILEYDAFVPVQGVCWILDEQNDGKIYKLGGAGALTSTRSYQNFDFSVNLKYDPELAKQGSSDEFLQQRSGMRIAFSNGKNWHINLLRENDKYILQYGKHSGENSATGWKTVHTLTDAQAAKYRSQDGIQLRIMRQGRYMAVWLDGTLYVIEMFNESFDSATATLGMEAWISNRTVMEFPFRISGNLPVDVAGSAFHWPAEIWDISNQYNGTFTKHPAPGKDTWLDGKLNVNDVTTIAKDLDPDARNYSFLYIFKFSNGENFRVRLNHTDNDGKYRIQSFAGATLFAPWKNHYTLTNAQAEKVKTEGVAFRVWICGTTAYVFIDGEPVCTYDLSKVVATGKPSGIDKATATVSFRLDGNLKGDTVIPFQMKLNNGKPPVLPVKPSEIVYQDFTATANLKYDTKLATQGTTDLHLQQRSGIRISFSNGKNWHIHMMKENDKYILQYARMSGDNSVTNWRTACVLNDAQAAQYESANGISLQVMRQGRYAAVWLGEKLVVIELFGEEYDLLTATIGPESWVSDRSVEDVKWSASAGVPVDVAGSAFHWPAEIWDISDQYNGTFTKHPAPGKDTWLDTQIDANDVTTIAKDLSPETNDYSFVYIFKFSNGENFRVRLNHTDNDGKYRIQSFVGSTLFAPWKNHYTLTDEQAEKVKTDGIAYRVRILGTTAYVFLDDEQVCTYDLSTNVNTGSPSGIENATARVSFRLDGNTVGDTVIPFKLEDNSDQVTVQIAQTANGTIVADKTAYRIGDTVKLTVTGAKGYYYSNLSIDQIPVMLDWDGTYSFIAEKNTYSVSGEFKSGILAENNDSAWNLLNQNQGVLLMESHTSGNSGWVSATGETNDVYTLVKDWTPDAKDFSMIYDFTFSNGEKFVVRLNHTDNDGKYRIQSMSGSTLFAPWKNAYTLTDEEAAKVQGDGIGFRVTVQGTKAYVTLDEVAVCTYDLSTVVATGKPSGIESATVSAAIRMDGNLGRDVEIPFVMQDVSKAVEIQIADMTNGTVVTDKNSYEIGETVTLIVTPNTGYCQKLYMDGQPLLLDYETGKYSFVATKNLYEVTGGFEQTAKWFWTEGWNLVNQGHGIIHAPAHPAGTQRTGDLVPEKGSCNSVSVLYQDVSKGVQKDFAIVLKMHFVGGKKSEVRLIDRDDNGKYCLQAMGDSFSGWNTLYWLTEEENAAVLNGDGVWYTMIREGTSIYLHINDSVVKEIDLSTQGITADTVLDQVKIQYYNFGYPVDLHYIFQTEKVPAVKVKLPVLSNGTVTANKGGYEIGETVTLTVSPADGYCQKLYIDGQPLLVDYETGKYRFVATKNIHEVTGSFEPKHNWFWTADWNLQNQAHGIAHAPAHPAGTERTGDLVPEKGSCNGISVLVTDASKGVQKDFAIVLKMHFVGGKKAEVRLIDRDDNGKYCLQAMGDSFSGWNTLYWLTDEENAAVLNGDGVWYTMIREGASIYLSINGKVVKQIEGSAQGITAGIAIDQIKIQAYNFGYAVDIPYTFGVKGHDVEIKLPTLANGTVTAERSRYQSGDIVNLTVTPNAGYSQKLYVNGEPVILEWKTNTYSFVATEEIYEITGSFEPSLQLDTNSHDPNRWDSANQAHGLITAYYPSNNDAWWYNIVGEYRSIAVNAKNYLPQADSAEGNGVIGYSLVLAATLDDGKTYGFRIQNERNAQAGEIRYIYTRFGASGSVTGWGGWCKLEDKVPGVTGMLQGDGVEFKLTRVGANTLQLTLDGVVLDTYTMDGVTDANKVTRVRIYHYGNKGQKVDIPFVLEAE